MHVQLKYAKSTIWKINGFAEVHNAEDNMQCSPHAIIALYFTVLILSIVVSVINFSWNAQWALCCNFGERPYEL